MQITETVSDGLKREFQVSVPAADLEAKLADRLAELKDRVQLRGFRPGKVPVTHLRKVYGRAVMAETIEAVIRELNAKIVEERGLKLAMEPKVTIPNEATEVERKIGGVPFEGGTGGDVGVNVGSGTFIPGFEDQLIGMAAGETRTVKVTFPANYLNAA